MSTVTAVKKNGYVAIAADTLVSVGPIKMSATYNKTCRKIVQVGDTTDDVVSIAAAGVRAAADFDTATSTPIESHLIRLAPTTVEEFDLPLHV